jgi:hypothetical protein
LGNADLKPMNVRRDSEPALDLPVCQGIKKSVLQNQSKCPAWALQEFSRLDATYTFIGSESNRFL